MLLRLQDHPQYSQVLEWIAQGEGPATIAPKLKPTITRQTLWRFMRDKVKPAMEGPATIIKDLKAKGLLREDISPEQALGVARSVTSVALASDPIRSRILKHQETVDACIQDAKDAKDGRTVAALLGADYRGIELDARITGRLTAGDQTTINIVVPMAAQPAVEPQDFEVIDIKPAER